MFQSKLLAYIEIVKFWSVLAQQCIAWSKDNDLPCPHTLAPHTPHPNKLRGKKKSVKLRNSHYG